MEHVETPARLGVPDPCGPVVAAAGKQLPVWAECERPDPGLGETPDHAAGARADDRRRGGLSEARRDGKDLSRRIEDGREDAAAEDDRLRPPGREVEESDVGAAPHKQRRPAERQRGDRRGRVDLVKGRAAPGPPDHDAAVERTRGEEPTVRTPGRLGQLMLPRQRLDQAPGAVVEAHMPVAAGDEEPIADNRMADGCQVRADLMPNPCGDIDREQRVRPVPRQWTIPRQCRTSRCGGATADTHAPRPGGDRAANLSAMAHVAVHHGAIFFAHQLRRRPPPGRQGSRR